MKGSNRGKRNSIAFTTQTTNKNDSKTRRSVSSLNLDNSENTLFDTLMNDPVKRKMIMGLLSQERENIEKYKQAEDKRKVKLKRNERLLQCESPTALLRRRALEQNRRDSDSSSTASDVRSTSTTPIPFETLLDGVVAYVEIRSNEEDRSAGAKALMQAMGAKIKDYFSTEVTHVVFKDGSFTTFQKAKLKKVHLVSILWLEAVRKNNFRVPEKNYPALGTEGFDGNMTQICLDYEKVVNEEKRRSRAIGLPSTCSKGRKTALPSELQAVQSRKSEVIIPTSQDWEAESIISCASGTLPYRRNIFPDQDSERLGNSTPELTSDNDSDCGLINGSSFKRDLSNLDLETVENVPDGTVNTTNNSSSTSSASLLARKSEGNRKSSYKLVDMDLTSNLNENCNKENLKLGKTSKKRRDSTTLLSDNSTNLLENSKQTCEYVGRRRSMRHKSDLPQEKLFKEPLDSVRSTRSGSGLIGKNSKKCSVSSDETPSLRFSTSSKDTTDKSSIRPSDVDQKNQNKTSLSTEEMPSLRISTSSNDTSNRKSNLRLSTEGVKAKEYSNSDEMPSLRVSSSLEGRSTRNSVKSQDNEVSDGQKEKKKTKRKLDSLELDAQTDSTGSLELPNVESKKRRSKDTESNLDVKKNNLKSSKSPQASGSLASEDMPSLRISTSSNDASNRKSARISGEKAKVKGGKKISNDEMSCLRISDSSLETSDFRSTRSSVKAQNNPAVPDSLDLGVQNDSLITEDKSSDVEPKKRRSKGKQDIVKNLEWMKNLSKSPTIQTPSSLTSEDMPSLRISTSSNDVSNGKSERLKGKDDKKYSSTSSKASQSWWSTGSSVKGQNNQALPDSLEFAVQNDSLTTEDDSLDILSDEKKNRRSKRKQDVENLDRKKNNIRSSKNPIIQTSDSITSEDMPPLRMSTSESNDIAEKPKEIDSKAKNSAKNLDLISENQTDNNKDGDIEDETSEANNSKTRGSTQSLTSENSVNNEANLSEDSTKSKNNSNASNSSRDSPKSTQTKPNQLNDNTNAVNSKADNKKYRKLYNLNQSVDAILKDFEWTEDDDVQPDPTPATSSNVVPKKTFTVPFVPISVTPLAKRLIDKRKKEKQSKKEKAPKKIPPKAPKKVQLSTSKDEQKELTNEYVNKKQKTHTDDEGVSNKRPTEKSRRSQRLSQHEKCNYQETSSTTTDSEDPIRPELNRRSTFDFVQTSQTKSQRKRKKKKITSIVCTRFHKPDVQTFMQVVRKLHGFFVQDEVTDHTTHLIVGETKRTINLLRALTRGCWILRQEWLFSSLEASKWLPEEDYEVTDFSPAVQQCRRERLAFGSLYSMDIFENCGPIYIARSSIPRRSDLQELVKLCKGTITNITSDAKVVVGQWMRYEHVICVTETWILDSITYNKQKSFKNYLIEQND